MLTLEQAAVRVANNVKTDGSDEQECFLDPATLMLICSILSAIFNGLRLYCQWKKNKKPAEAIKDGAAKQSLFNRLRLRRIARQKMGDQDYQQRGEKIVEALFTTGAQATIEDIENLLQQANNDSDAIEVNWA